jgi:uncharacterized membrane protein YcaP (DUF421 family)
MFFLQVSTNSGFSWNTLLLGEEDWWFLGEVVLRSVIMFIISLASLRIIGKRGIMQGVFEIVVIITLGSAAGDPMFYRKVGLLPAILVFVMIIMMYKLVNYLVARNKKFEHLIEGSHVKLISDGKFIIKNFSHEDLSKDEFFSDLRLKNISQLGQVQSAYVEASGEISVFFFPDHEVKYGLNILPEKLKEQIDKIAEEGMYSCSFCGHTGLLTPGNNHTCPECNKQQWTKSSKNKRVV